MLEVSFGSKILSNKMMISPLEARKKLNVCWNIAGESNLYSLIILEYEKSIVNFLAINIPDNRIQDSKIIRNFVIPDSPGKYIIDLIKQKSNIEVSPLELTDFNYLKWSKKHELKPVDRISFVVNNAAPKFTSESY